MPAHGSGVGGTDVGVEDGMIVGVWLSTAVAVTVGSSVVEGASSSVRVIVGERTTVGVGV